MDDDEIYFSQGWSWQGAVALGLAIGVFLSTCTLFIGLAVKIADYTYADQINPVAVSILTGVISILVGAIAAFLGKINMEAGETTGSADEVE